MTEEVSYIRKILNLDLVFFNILLSFMVFDIILWSWPMIWVVWLSFFIIELSNISYLDNFASLQQKLKK